MRFDLQIIASWIEPGSRVIDLGCGEGDLLKFLIDHKGATGNGIEHNESKVAHCIEKGLYKRHQGVGVFWGRIIFVFWVISSI